MNEFTTMYQYFKGISETTDDKSSVTLKTIELEKIDPSHYLEMKSSDSNNNEIATQETNAIANLSYLNVDSEKDFESVDTVDAPVSMEMQPLKKRDSKDLINNLNNMKIKEEDEKEITNELKITEENYYDSNEYNKTTPITITDDFSNVCLENLENISQTETLSTNSIPSSNSDNQQQSLFSDYLIQPSNIPVVTAATASDAFADYLIQPSNIPVHENWPQKFQSQDEHNYLNQPANRSYDQVPESSHLRLYFKKKQNENNKSAKPPSSAKLSRSTNTLKRNDSDASSKKSVDDELVEIINDFKNNVFTIQECEELVNTWKNRNDVKKSFKEKQEQLQLMREEYEKIQQRLKDNLKRPSPFERVKRIFSKKHEKPAIAFSLPINLSGDASFTTNNSNSSHRPNSTLSLHSASSSNSSSTGRMSTSSQASAGDSGTHSDHEENRSRQANAMMENYLIPPAPRPILLPLSPDDKGSLMSFSMNQIITTPTSADTLNEHYILFPSNVPIFPTSPTTILPPHMSSMPKKYAENTFITFKGNK